MPEGTVRELQGVRAAVLIEQMYQELEVWYPVYRLREAGCKVVLVGSQRSWAEVIRTQKAPQRRLQHCRQPGVHERLAAGEADQAGAEAQRFDLVEIFIDLGAAQVNQPVIFGRGFYVAMLAGQVAQRAGIEPQRVQRSEGDLRPWLALGREERVLKLARIQL